MALTSLYIGLLYGLYVPDWQFEPPGNPGSIDTNTSFSTNSSVLLVDTIVDSIVDNRSLHVRMPSSHLLKI